MQSPIIGPIPDWLATSALLIGWPENIAEWGEHLSHAQSDIAQLAKTATKAGSKIILCCQSPKGVDAAQKACGANIETWQIPMGDIWLRDTGPVFQGKSAHCFGFNGWGGKFIMAGDTQTNNAIAAHLPHAHEKTHDWVLEGGAIEVDGAGTLITTKQCLLNPNRGGDRNLTTIDAKLKADLAVKTTVWLERGLIGDHTDGHVDNIARFANAGHVICQTPSGANDPNQEIYAEICRTITDAGLTLTTIPSPGRILDAQGDIAPASHMNFVVLPRAVIFPVYEDVFAKQAQAALSEVFEGRQIIPLRSTGLLEGGGSFHCCTLHLPQFQD